MKGRAKNIVLTSSLFPGSAVYSRALKTKKSIPALSQGSVCVCVGGGGGGGGALFQMTGA